MIKHFKNLNILKVKKCNFTNVIIVLKNILCKPLSTITITIIYDGFFIRRYICPTKINIDI